MRVVIHNSQEQLHEPIPTDCEEGCKVRLGEVCPHGEPTRLAKLIEAGRPLLTRKRKGK